MIEQLEQECWGLDFYIAKTLLPKLLYFKNWCYRYGCPSELEIDEWNEVLDEIVWAFTYVLNEYPSTTKFIIEDIGFGEKTDSGFVKIEYKDGFTEEDYNQARLKDQANIARCQQGINLFAQYYMSLWN